MRPDVKSLNEICSSQTCGATLLSNVGIIAVRCNRCSAAASGAAPGNNQAAAQTTRPKQEQKPEFFSRPLSLEVQMKFHLSRAVTAFGLGASLWFGSVS